MNKNLMFLFVLLVIAISCQRNDKNWQKYSSTINDAYFSYDKENNSISMLKSTFCDDESYELNGTIIFSESKVKIKFDSIKNSSPEIVLFDYNLGNDTMHVKWPIISDGFYQGGHDSKITLDSTFYYEPYNDSIFTYTITNYRLVFDSDDMVFFVGKEVGIVGLYCTYYDRGEHFILYASGNLFFDIFFSKYKYAEFFPRM